MKQLPFLLLLAGLTAAQAQSFIDPTPGADWFTSANWDPATVPSEGDTAWIDQGYSALLANGASTISQLNLGNSTFGSLVVSGTNASLDVTSQLAVGFGEEAGSTLTIQAGATLTSTVTLIGLTTAGSLTVTGTGSRFIGGTNFLSTQIAAGGIFTVSDGAHASTEGGIVAFGPAYLNVTGSGSVLTTGDSMFYGDGVVTISNGGTMAHTTNMAFGSENGMIFNVSGTNSAMVATDQFSSLRVGFDGRGVLNISGGATVTSGAASLGVSNVSDVGVVTVSGTGSRWNVGQGLEIGNVGTGTMTISDGGSVVSSGQQTIGRSKNGAAGTVVISGTGSSWDTEGNTLIVASSSNTLGNLTVENGGSLNVGGNGVFLAQARTATANILQTGGTINAGIVSFGVGTSLYQLEGGTLRVGGNGGIAASASGTSTFELAGGTIQVSGGALSSSVRFTMRTNTTSVIDTQTSSATLSGVLSGGGGLNKIGAGTLTLSGSNTHLGGVTLSSGTLSLGNNAALGTGSLVIAGNSTVQAVTAARTLANNLTLGSGFTGTVGGSTNLTLGGTISGGGALAKIGAGTLTLSGSNTHLGGFTLSSGTLSLGNDAALGTGSLVIAGNSTVQAVTAARTLANNLTLGSGFTGTIAGSTNLTLGGTISGGGALAKIGTGTLVLSASNTYTGTTTVSGGRLQIGMGGTTGSISSRLVNNGEVAFNRSDAVVYSGTISGSGSLTQAGTGRLTLTGSNSYSGGTTVSSGTLSVGHKNAVGTGTVVIDGGVYVIETAVSATNSVTISSGTFSRSLAASSSLVNAVDASSGTGGVVTFATLLAGETSAATTLQTSFAATSAATNDEFRRSDVYSFEGSGADIFTLQLSFTATSPDSYLGWLNGNQWENAVNGNAGNNALSAQQGYVGSFAQFQLAYGNDLSQYIGAWGTDVVGGTTKVWAVLNHNSDFSIVPEPGTCALIMLGVGTLLVSRRRKEADRR
jgi:fibronectin-binding autotransporter adhesin